MCLTCVKMPQLMDWMYFKRSNKIHTNFRLSDLYGSDCVNISVLKIEEHTNIPNRCTQDQTKWCFSKCFSIIVRIFTHRAIVLWMEGSLNQWQPNVRCNYEFWLHRFPCSKQNKTLDSSHFISLLRICSVYVHHFSAWIYWKQIHKFCVINYESWSYF